MPGAPAIRVQFPGPDWAWRTVVRATNDGWELVMYNVSPDGEETLAFHNIYAERRRG